MSELAKKAVVHKINKYDNKTECGLMTHNVNPKNLRRSAGKSVTCGRCKIVIASQAKKKGGKK